jgi:hypothetical protein
LCKSRKKCDIDPDKDYTSIWERKHEPYTEIPNSPRSKKVRQVKNKLKSMLIISFDIIMIVHKESMADQTVSFAYCCDVLWQLHENV